MRQLTRKTKGAETCPSVGAGLWEGVAFQGWRGPLLAPWLPSLVMVEASNVPSNLVVRKLGSGRFQVPNVGHWDLEAVASRPDSPVGA